MSQGPMFSVLVTAFDREHELRRCLESCWAQSFSDFEVVVVDDASRDGTAAMLEALAEPRLRLVRHEHNQGISAARATAVDHARGHWLVMLDSDWELYPDSLARLAAVIGSLPAGVRIIRSRLELDGGELSPGITPEGVTDYAGRLRWLEQIAIVGAHSDAGHCIHRAVFTKRNYYRDRRGALETLWELDLALREPSLWIQDVLGRQHFDAANSHTREADAARLIGRLVAEAHDQRWMAETMLERHGAALAIGAPHYRRWLLQMAQREALLDGDRSAGIRHTRAAARAGARGPQVWATLGLGLIGPRVLARAKLAGRLLRAHRVRVVGGDG